MATIIKTKETITGAASDRVTELMDLINSIKIGYEGNVGDAVFYNSSTGKIVIADKDEDFATNYPAGQYIPIGVVAIPTSHDVYGTGQCGVMSLSWMNYSTPDEGSSSAQSIYWGQYNVDTSLSNMDVVNYAGTCTTNNSGYTANNSSTELTGTSTSAYLPSDNTVSGSTWPICAHDTNSAYGCMGSSSSSYSTGNCAPSPYLTDGSRNPIYYQTESPSTIANALSDFDGIGNTSVLLELATAQSDWKTNNTITNNSGEGYSPAACCCYRYNTPGTYQGDWYLPACGEVGYAYARYKTIAATIDKLSGIYQGFDEVPPIGITTGSYWWSSSEYSSVYARGVYFGFGSSGVAGSVYGNFKNGSYCVRAFWRL